MKFKKTKRTRDKVLEGFNFVYIIVIFLCFLIGGIMMGFENSDGGSVFGIGLVMSILAGIFLPDS